MQKLMVAVFLSVADIEALDRISKAEGVSRSALVRGIIDKYLADYLKNHLCLKDDVKKEGE